MGKDLIDVTLTREDTTEPWGFRLAGGKDFGQPLSISQVTKNSLAAKVGIAPNDLLITVGELEVFDMTHAEAEKTIQEAGNRFSMVIERETTRKISFEKSATTFALKLGGGHVEVERKDEAFISNVPITEETPSMAVESVNFKKFEKKAIDMSGSKTLEEMSRANLKKDWNCPWVRGDGRGLKQFIRYIDEPNAPAKTSQQHYYSEPKSILAPDPVLTKEQIQDIIREHGAESRPESRQQEGAGQQQEVYKQEQLIQQQQQEMRQQERSEMVETRKVEVQSQQQLNMVSEEQETYFRDRDLDSQAPPDLEPVSLVQQGFVMPGQFPGQVEGYEPSADELIDVLKNLENLAAGNPDLYRSIVEQIKGSTSSVFQQQTVEQRNGNSQYEQEMYEQQLYQQQQQEQQLYQEQQMYQSQQEEQLAYQQQQEQMAYQQQQEQLAYQQQQEQQLYQEEQQVYQQHEEHSMQSSVQQSFSQQQVEQSMAQLNMSEAEYAQHMKMKRLEAEAQEEVRQTLAKQREAKMKKTAEPPKPKEITVIAGDGKAVKVQLGVDKQEDSRKQVAEAAGLKHVPLPDFDANDDSAWAGSLKRTSKTKAREEVEIQENPWAGSLRHVNKPKGPERKDERDDLYGGAPWMGTLRHVVHDNRVTKNYGVNQFQSKRYPDEDATNPFEASGGSAARPAFPLTPAAIINGSVLSRDEMARKEEEEELERIRSNIGSKTVSSALLQVLMPKLLKMHETKYTPMDRVDAEKIMEEILGMQIGINPDQQADANEEAEMIIRAIMQDEVDKSVYSRMADDLEAANKKIKKLKKAKKVKETAPPITA